MSYFALAHNFTAEWEGGLSNDKFDAGGITKYGVSIVFLTDVYNESKANRAMLNTMLGLTSTPKTEDIKSLTKAQAEELFRWQFWGRLGLDAFPVRPAVFLYDCAVNHGRSTAVKLTQRGCNAAGWTPALIDDGILGPKSHEAFMSATSDKFVDCAVTARENYYKAIVRNKPTQSVFINGWLNRAKALRSYLKGL